MNIEGIELNDKCLQEINEAVKSIGKAMLGTNEMFYEAFKRCAEAVVEMINSIDLDELLSNILDDLELPCKPIHNYPEYKCIKPNTKPYIAFKRLYRVQVR